MNDLVKRLRDHVVDQHSLRYVDYPLVHVLEEAADRIKELENKYSSALMLIDKDTDYIEELESRMKWIPVEMVYAILDENEVDISLDEYTTDTLREFLTNYPQPPESEKE